jgi:thioredoxin-like negative regulator of GroEL
MTALTLANYKTQVTDYPGTVILFFHAPWDTPGLKTAKFLRSEGLIPQEPKIFSVDYDTERELVQKFSVRELPQVFCLKSGEVIGQTDVCETVEQLTALRNQ